MLTTCTACQGNVSSAAAACPHCGHPMSIESTGVERQQRVTTQATGREVKGHQLAGLGILAFGTILAIAVPGYGAWLLAVVGMFWITAASFMSWWRYG